MIRRVIDFLLRNIWYKVAALILAILVWGIVQGEEIVEFNRRIKVNISVANGFAVKGRPYRYIDATLRGPRVLLGEISNRPLEAKIFIPSNQTGNLDIPFEKESIKDWDNRIKLIVRENYISVFVDEQVSRDVPIREVIQGAPAEGYFVEKVAIKPEKITVTGIKSEVMKLDDVITEPIDITRLNQTTSFDVALAPSSLGPNAYSEERVKVTLSVGDSRVNRTVEGVNIVGVGSEYQYRVTPKAVAVILQGTPHIVNVIDKSNLKGFIDLTNLKPGRYEREVQVKIPARTALIEAQPATVKVEILNSKKSR